MGLGWGIRQGDFLGWVVRANRGGNIRDLKLEAWPQCHKKEGQSWVDIRTEVCQGEGCSPLMMMVRMLPDLVPAPEDMGSSSRKIHGNSECH